MDLHADYKGNSRPILRLAMFFGFAAAAFAIEVPQGPVIEMEEISVEVMSGESLLFRVISAEAVLEEETQKVWMNGPLVSIYGPDTTLKEKVAGQQGRLWPVEVDQLDGQGLPERVRKFDWALSGEVMFESTRGHLIKTPELLYSNQHNQITSTAGIEYRIPTGENSYVFGRADALEIGVDPGGNLSQWTLLGNIKMSSATESKVEP